MKLGIAASWEFDGFIINYLSHSDHVCPSDFWGLHPGLLLIRKTTAICYDMKLTSKNYLVVNFTSSANTRRCKIAW